jgi:hypothetical protein
MAKFVNQERFLILLKDYQFKFYDSQSIGQINKNNPHKCEEQIQTIYSNKEKLQKEKELPFEERLPSGFQQEIRTDEMLDYLIESMDNYIVFKKECLKNHIKCHKNENHRKKMDEDLKKLEKELGSIIDKMVKEIFKKWYGGYTNYYKNELIALGVMAMWEKLTHFNTEFKYPFSYYTTTIRRAMNGFLSEFREFKKTTMSLTVFEDINSA